MANPARVSNNRIASWGNKVDLFTEQSSLLSTCHLFVCCFIFLPKKGGAPRSRVSAVGACKAQRTAGSPAPAVLQPDALPVGLDTEADRCHLKKKPDHMKRDRRSSRTGRRTQRSICLNHRTKPIKLHSSVYDLNYDNIKKVLFEIQGVKSKHY